MHRYSRMHLSPEVAMRNLGAIDLEEKSRIAEGIALIAVIDERRDYLAAGYSCMRAGPLRPVTAIAAIAAFCTVTADGSY